MQITRTGFPKQLTVLAALLLMISSASALGINEGSLNPSDLSPGETVNNQKVTFQVEGLSADGNTDTFQVRFANVLADDLSVNSASTDKASTTSSAELVDGWDNDDVTETVKFSVSPDDGGKMDLQGTVDVSVTYPQETEEYPISVYLVDSEFGEATEQVAKMKVDTDSDTSSGSTSTNTNSNSNSNSGSTDSNTNTNSGADDTGSQTQTDPNTGSNTNTNSGADDTGSQTQTDSNVNTGSSSDSSANTGSSSTSSPGDLNSGDDSDSQQTGDSGGFLGAIADFLNGLF